MLPTRQMRMKTWMKHWAGHLPLLKVLLGYSSEDAIKGLFSDFSVNNSQLGNTVARNALIASGLTSIRGFGSGFFFDKNNIDVFAGCMEFLMKMYASQAGKSGGEFFTPQEVRFRTYCHDWQQGTKDGLWPLLCGSGSLLLKFSKLVPTGGYKFYGQEINPTTYNLCRINMFLHDINFANFDIQLEDTLTHPQHLGMQFDGIVSNPPYSKPWAGAANSILINDERYSPVGILAPKSKADLAFTMHMLYHFGWIWYGCYRWVPWCVLPWRCRNEDPQISRR